MKMNPFNPTKKFTTKSLKEADLDTVSQSTKREENVYNDEELGNQLKELELIIDGKQSTGKHDVLTCDQKSDQFETETIYESDISPVETLFRSNSLDDLKLREIEVDADNNEKVGDEDEEEEISFSFTDIKLENNKKDINMQDKEIIEAIVNQLKDELQPCIDKLTSESEKYQILKKLYKLPSISNLNEQVKSKYKRGARRFNLEFDEAIIEQLIQNQKLEFQNLNQKNIMSVNDQVNINFNKFRQLSTIDEGGQDSTNSDLSAKPREQEKDFKSPVKEKENGSRHKNCIYRETEEVYTYKCQELSYSRFKDNRSIKELLTDELLILLNKLQNGSLKDLNKVQLLCSIFEKGINDSLNPISKVSNSNLQRLIKIELKRRRAY